MSDDVSYTQRELIATSMNVYNDEVKKDYYEYTAMGFKYLGNTLYAGVQLDKREQFCLKVESKVKEYKIVLSNGQVYIDETQDDIKNKNINMAIVNIDDKNRYGAKIYIEYEISVINESNIECFGYTLLTGNNFEYNKELNLLSIENEKSSKEWEILQDIKGYVNTDKVESKEQYLILKKDNINLKRGEKDTYRLVFTKKLDEECIFTNITEIIEYKNKGLKNKKDVYEGGRRNYNYSKDWKSGTKCIAGSYWKGEDNTLSNEIPNDTGISERVVIIPPTGDKINANIFYISICLVCSIIIFILKKKKEKSRK